MYLYKRSPLNFHDFCVLLYNETEESVSKQLIALAKKGYICNEVAIIDLGEGQSECSFDHTLPIAITDFGKLTIIHYWLIRSGIIIGGLIGFIASFITIYTYFVK